jgi:hypothetical protein
VSVTGPSRFRTSLPTSGFQLPHWHPYLLGREVDRHQRIVERIRGLLADLGEPRDPADVEP